MTLYIQYAFQVIVYTIGKLIGNNIMAHTILEAIDILK